MTISLAFIASAGVTLLIAVGLALSLMDRKKGKTYSVLLSACLSSVFVTIVLALSAIWTGVEW